MDEFTRRLIGDRGYDADPYSGTLT